MNHHPDDIPPFMQAASAPPTNQHPFGVPSFMFAVDFAAMNASKFSENENMAVAAPDDGEFIVGMKYSLRKSIISAIRS
ncbi:hypothetical protein PIB30_045984 [Stylosanthes scabra]|uniref:Uncharacterized protein n=1 Tax=Stylosanthes scabra TaxID=79078 RepID=A0ABU6TG09_9FABA|nr:hypothetical protein [Stylosanthes scabra]